MPVDLKSFPVAAIVDLLLSYLQHNFSNIELTPSEFRWNNDETQSLIRISAPFVIDNAKPMLAPFIVVERGGFVFSNSVIDNVKKAKANVLTDVERVDWMDGTVNIICGSGVATEASCLANYLAIMFQADRSAIMKTSKFIRNLNYVDIGPEVPVVKDSEVRRYEVTLRLKASLQIGWCYTERKPVQWNSANIFMTEKPYLSTSEDGQTTAGSALLVDNTKNFGNLITNDPQLLQKEFDAGWYYIKFKDDTTNELYTIIEIVDANTLKLQTHDVNDLPVNWSASETKTGVEYDLIWNSLHIHTKLPNATS